MTSAAPESNAPFAVASKPRPLGDGTFTATLRSEWSINGKPHGGFLLALFARAAYLAGEQQGEVDGDPVSVSAEFVRGMSLGPVLLRSEVRKVGRQTSFIDIQLEQRGQVCAESSVIFGQLPTHKAAWNDLPVLPAEPPPNSIPVAEDIPGFANGVFRLVRDCDVRLDSASAGLLARNNVRPGKPPAQVRTGDRQPAPRMQLWVRPRNTDPDLYFSLVAADVNPPLPFLAGRMGWAPTVQMTALLRARPAPGWLRVQVESRSVGTQWFDSDATVMDSTGQLICQARQLALTPGA